MLATIQFMYFKLMGLIFRQLTPSVLMTELLAGENFFEILWHDAYYVISSNNFFTLIKFIALIYFEMILIFFVLCASADYSYRQQNYFNSKYKSIKISFQHWRIICAWGFIELCTQGFSSLFGTIGALFYLAWNLITIFDVQILIFEHVSVGQIIKKSWQLFKKTFRQVIAFDVIIEGLLIIFAFILYIATKQYITNFPIPEAVNYNGILIFLILYLISSVMILEVVVFTGFYQKIKKSNDY